MMPAGESSSSVELSPPPKSPESPKGKIVLGEPLNYPDLSKASGSAATKDGVVDPPAKAPRKKRGRAATAEKAEVSEKPAKQPRKPRQTRKTKEAAAAAATASTAAGSATAASATSSKTASSTQPTTGLKGTPNTKTGGSSRQSKITDLVSSASPSTSSPGPAAAQPQSTPVPASAQSTGKIAGGSEAIPTPAMYKPEPGTSTPALHNINQSPRSSHYDPIRASVLENPRPTSSAATPLQNSPVKIANRASASPSISSLIDPPSASGNTSFSYNATSKQSPTVAYTQPHLSPPNSTMPGTHTMAKNSSTTSSPKPAPASVSSLNPTSATQKSLPSAMDVDSPEDNACAPTKSTSRKPSTGGDTKMSSKAPSPKPRKEKKDKDNSTPPLPPLPGSGTLSATLFGGAAAVAASDAVQAPTVILEVKLESGGNKYVNFAKLAEERYGFNALHPRLAAQRERLARVAAAGAALENAAKANGASGDEMSLDLSEGENEMSNAEMGGTGTGAGSVTGDAPDGEKKVRKKRQLKMDMYDKEDPFVDDSEMAWEEQQAASKDGFFVYQGPLVPEGETAKVERADGTMVKPPGTGRGRGRGRGGGPGSRGGRGGGGGPGSRGGQTTRKPRMKKAERAAVEAERAAKEGNATVLPKPTGFGAAGAGASPEKPTLTPTASATATAGAGA